MRTAPARLVAGLAARRRADAGPLALVPCDNIAGQRRDRPSGSSATWPSWSTPTWPTWLDESVAVVTTMVDRITPRTDAGGRRAPCSRPPGSTIAARSSPSRSSEWVLSGAFPAGRPRWEDAGATFTDDVTPFEHRKLWLLNGAHSLLAYAGSIRGHTTVAEAVADDDLPRRGWRSGGRRPRRTWTSPPTDVAAYRAALLERFANARMHDRLDRIAADGSQKLPIRILPVLRAERAGGPGARRAPRACSPPGSATCAASAHPSATREPTRSCRSLQGPLRGGGAARARAGWTRRSAPTPTWSRPSSTKAEQLSEPSPR